MRVSIGVILWLTAMGPGVSLGLAQEQGDYVAREAAYSGVIAGTVSLSGGTPLPERLAVTSDREVCDQEPKFDESIIVAPETRGLKNVVVRLTDITEGKAWDHTSRPPELSQIACRFAPHVLIVPARQTFDIVNSDGILHNIHTRGSKNRPMNKAHPSLLKRLKMNFKRPDLIAVKCDVHDWMSGWIVVASHPYYAVTDSAGKFELQNVPPGTYTLELWHEKLDKEIRQVTVTAGGRAQVDVEFTAGH